MRLALGQLDICFENKESNKNKVIKFVHEAAENNTDIILFPEMTLTGFSMNLHLTKDINNESILFFKDLAAKYKINIGFGWTNVNSEKGENHYTIVDGQEQILADYVKIHPFSYAKEDQYFISGDKIVEFHVNDFIASVFICYDLRFPEIFQAASKNASVVFIPANWPARRREHWKSLLKARAIENQIYIVGINCVGNQGDLDFSGDSCVINPLGEIVEEISEKEGLIICDIQNDVNSYQNSFPVKKDRKSEFYKMLY